MALQGSGVLIWDVMYWCWGSEMSCWGRERSVGLCSTVSVVTRSFSFLLFHCCYTLENVFLYNNKDNFSVIKLHQNLNINFKCKNSRG